MPLPRLWSVIAGFNRMSKAENAGNSAAHDPEQEKGSFNMAASFGKKTTLDCLPREFQQYLKSCAKNGGSDGQ
jgi:hypothetical protein